VISGCIEAYEFQSMFVFKQNPNDYTQKMSAKWKTSPFMYKSFDNEIIVQEIDIITILE
jgi:hypothetical protein